MGKTSWDDFMLEAVFDLLVEKHEHRGNPGEVLTSMASEIVGDTVVVGDILYHAVSHAILELERLGMVEVERRNRREAEKANIILGIRLKE